METSAAASSGGVPSVFGSVVARVRRALRSYDILTATPGRVLPAAAAILDRLEGCLITGIGADTLPALETSRPGYGSTAQSYLDEGHVGFAIWCEGRIAAITWLFHNGGRRRRHVTYYPLDPGRAWLHASWTHPAFRGRGFHKALIVQRVQYVQEHYGDVVSETNVELGNQISAHNWVACGFVRSGSLYLLSAGGVQHAWKRMQGPG